MGNTVSIVATCGIVTATITKCIIDCTRHSTDRDKFMASVSSFYMYALVVAFTQLDSDISLNVKLSTNVLFPTLGCLCVMALSNKPSKPREQSSNLIELDEKLDTPYKLNITSKQVIAGSSVCIAVAATCLTAGVLKYLYDKRLLERFLAVRRWYGNTTDMNHEMYLRVKNPFFATL